MPVDVFLLQLQCLYFCLVNPPFSDTPKNITSSRLYTSHKTSPFLVYQCLLYIYIYLSIILYIIYYILCIIYYILYIVNRRLCPIYPLILLDDRLFNMFSMTSGRRLRHGFLFSWVAAVGRLEPKVHRLCDL